MTILALMGLASCLAMALNTVVMVVIAAFHGSKITLDFNRFHEHLTELILCPVSFGLGMWGFFYLAYWK
jgi:hypothetical protein